MSTFLKTPVRFRRMNRNSKWGSVPMQLSYLTHDDFYFRWRFFESEEKYTLLSEEERQEFKPLSERSSQALWDQWIGPLKAQWFVSPDQRPPPTILEGDAGEWREDVQRRLDEHLGLPPSALWYFFWSPQIGVETTWGLFLKHWDDFCYPSDEDNVGISPGGQRSLIYNQERFWVLSRKIDT